MKIKTVTVELGHKKTINFQSQHNSVGFTADVEEADDPTAVVRQLQRKAAELLLKMETPKRAPVGETSGVQQEPSPPVVKTEQLSNQEGGDLR